MPLKLVKRHSGKNWYIRGTIRGISVDETTGTDERDRAEEIRIRRETEILDRTIHGIRKTITFLEASVMYLEGGGNPRFVNRIARHFGTTPLDKIDQLAIDRAAQRLYPEAAPATVNRQLYTPVSAILHFAARRKLCDAPTISRPKLPKGRIRWITIEEANGLLDCSAAHLTPLLIFLFYTGARLSEALYLDWRNIHLARAHVEFLDTKTGEDRGVPLHPRVIAALDNLKHREGAVFRKPDGQPYEMKKDGGGQIKTGFKNACRRAGILNFNPHDCRHTWATWHYSINRDLIALMKLGGWKSEKMVLRYAHVNVENLASTVNNIPWGNSGEECNPSESSKRKSIA